MGIITDHRRYAEQCVAMARLAGDNNDRALWLLLAQSWVRLAEHAARGETDLPVEETGFSAEESDVPAV